MEANKLRLNQQKRQLLKRECVSFETSDLSRELSIVSDDTKERLKHSLAVRQTAREQQPKEVEVVVPTQGFALVN